MNSPQIAALGPNPIVQDDQSLALALHALKIVQSEQEALNALYRREKADWDARQAGRNYFQIGSDTVSLTAYAESLLGQIEDYLQLHRDRLLPHDKGEIAGLQVAFKLNPPAVLIEDEESFLKSLRQRVCDFAAELMQALGVSDWCKLEVKVDRKALLAAHDAGKTLPPKVSVSRAERLVIG